MRGSWQQVSHNTPFQRCHDIFHRTSPILFHVEGGGGGAVPPLTSQGGGGGGVGGVEGGGGVWAGGGGCGCGGARGGGDIIGGVQGPPLLTVHSCKVGEQHLETKVRYYKSVLCV